MRIAELALSLVLAGPAIAEEAHSRLTLEDVPKSVAPAEANPRDGEPKSSLKSERTEKSQGPEHVTVARTKARIKIDGRLDEAAWKDAPVFSRFVESFPKPGIPASFRTEARLLVDDEFIYVGVTCFDPEPNLIARQLGRRDSSPASDQVEVAIDSNGDKRTAYGFIVNAAGVLRDRLLFSDFNSTDTWDAVWDGAAQVTESGWIAEFAIPLRALRFSGKKAWSIEIRRLVPRTHQTFDSTLIPPEANPQNSGSMVVSRFGPLDGLPDMKSTHDIEIAPYLAARAVFQPQYTDPSIPYPRLFDPSGDLGVDFKASLTTDLIVTGTINPDFGQVDADQVIQNLSTQEQYFPERRPFFLQGMDIFQSVGAEYGSPQQMFYSRRMGLDTPILGAAKVSGTVLPDLDVGFLDVVVMGDGNPALVPAGYDYSYYPFSNVLEAYAPLNPFQSSPDRRFQFHLTEPLHFGTDDSLPLVHPISMNYFAGVVRERFWGNSSVGLIVTSAVPLAPACTAAEFESNPIFAPVYSNDYCAAWGANAVGADWNLRTASGEWGFFGQVDGSEEVVSGERPLGAPPLESQLRDGTWMHPGDFGFGGYARAGKLGGEPFRFDVVYMYDGRRLDLNASGYQPLNNVQAADLNLHYVKPSGFDGLHNFGVDYNLDLNFSADSQWLPRGINSSLQTYIQLPTFDYVGARIGLEVPQYDLREIVFANVPFQRLSDAYLALWAASDSNRRLFGSGDIFGARIFGSGIQPSEWTWGGDFNVTWRPLDPLETRLDGSYAHRRLGARWVDTYCSPTDTDTLCTDVDPSATTPYAVFGSQDAQFLSLTLREQYVITTRLSLQVYAQLFSGVVLYGPFYSVNLTGATRISSSDVTPAPSFGTYYNGHEGQLNVNVVLRWEYRLGSVLYLVYTRASSEMIPVSTDAYSTGVLPSHLFQGPATDTFLVKWSYWFNI
jgi:hypothetical protein